MKSLVILISGRGSNMEALIDAKFTVRIAAVISNRPDTAGLAGREGEGGRGNASRPVPFCIIAA